MATYGTFGFILGELLRRVTGRTVGEFLREHIAGPLSADLFIGLPVQEHARCADMINKPHIREALAAAGAPEHPTSLAEHGKAGLAVAMGFIPDDELNSHAIDVWRSAEFPATNAHVSALAMATFYNAMAQEKLLSRELMELCRVSQGGFATDVVLGPASPTTVGVWATCSTSAVSQDRTRGYSATAVAAAPTHSPISNTGSDTPT